MVRVAEKGKDRTKMRRGRWEELKKEGEEGKVAAVADMIGFVYDIDDQRRERSPKSTVY